MRFYILLAFIAFSSAACSRTRFEYKDEDGKSDAKLTVPVGGGNGTLEVGFPTEWGYPVIIAYYGSAATEANHLKHLGIILKIDDKEIQPDSEEYQVRYDNQVLSLAGKDCCALLGDRLGIDATRKNGSLRFGVDIVKRYKSLKTLPPSLEVVSSVTSDQGMREMKKNLNLSSFKDSGFIRVH